MLYCRTSTVLIQFIWFNSSPSSAIIDLDSAALRNLDRLLGCTGGGTERLDGLDNVQTFDDLAYKA